MNIDDAKKLQQKKYREQFGRFLVEGEHGVLELQKAAQSNPLLRRSELYVTDAHADWHSPFEIHVVSARQMALLSETKSPQGIVAVAPLLPDAAPELAAGERAIYLHEVQDPGNLGTILRTLAWFGGFRCLLGPGSVDPFNSKVVRASMGGLFHVPLERDVPLDTLRARFPRVACLDMQGAPVRGGDFADFDCYLFGNEARGLPRDALAALRASPFAIHGAGAIESLNLATVVNICAFELSAAARR